MKILFINFRPIIAILGYATAGTGSLIFICSIVDLFTSKYEFENLFINALLLIFLGFCLAYTNKNHITSKMSLKEGFLLTGVSWLWIVFISAMPFYFSGLNIDFISSLFESMSGFSTTGATIIPNLNELSYGLNLWRAILQWIGGIGIIITSTALISQLGSSGMQIFKIEGFETFDNPLTKAIDIIKGIVKIYILLTIIFFLALWLIAKIDFFDALIHTLTNISTAGFSTKNQSIAYFNNYTADIILIIMMFFGGSPFILIYYSIFLKKPSSLIHDEQFKGYVVLLLFLSFLMTSWLFIHNQFSLKKSFIEGTFTVVSTMTGTGSIIADYSKWGNFPNMLIFIAMFIGGCAGSSACGMKVYRFQVAFKIASMTIKKMFQKNHIILTYYNNTVIDSRFAYMVFSYLFLIFIIVLIVAAILSAIGLDFDTALTGSITCLMNVGPGFGPIIGPIDNFSSLPDSAKFVLTIAMFIGRIEIFGAFVLFYKSFWRN